MPLSLAYTGGGGGGGYSYFDNSSFVQFFKIKLMLHVIYNSLKLNLYKLYLGSGRSANNF